MNPWLLEAHEVTVRRDGRDILHRVDLSIEPGQSVALTGPSGSGKTTLLAVLAGLQPPDQGQVRLGGVDLADLDPSVRHRGLGIVFQGYGLLSLLTAAENVELALQVRGAPRAVVRARAAAALAAVGLVDRGEHLVEELSGGEQQRVAVARALVAQPSLVLADEPTAELDEAARTRVLAELLQVPGAGGTLILATHDDGVAAACERQFQLADGRLSLVRDGTPD
jgi:putative ABC transport system ATP-binding protein